MEGLRRTARSFAQFLDRLGRGPSSGSHGSASPAAGGTSEDMFSRRVVSEPMPKTRRIRPEEYGLSADGRPLRSGNYPTYHPLPIPQEPRPIPSHIPGPPPPPPPPSSPPSTSSTTSASTMQDKTDVPSAPSQDNEIRTGGHIPEAATAGKGIPVVVGRPKPGGQIHVTDE